MNEKCKIKYIIFEKMNIDKNSQDLFTFESVSHGMWLESFDVYFFHKKIDEAINEGQLLMFEAQKKGTEKSRNKSFFVFSFDQKRSNYFSFRILFSRCRHFSIFVFSAGGV